MKQSRLFLFSLFFLAAEPLWAKPLKWGGRGWVLIIDGEEDLLSSVKQNWYLPWCFESIRGKMAAKKLDVQLVLSTDDCGVGPSEGLTTAPEDHDILLCLASALKEERPNLPSGQYSLHFHFNKTRR